jgi:hypothetical protein
MHGGWVLNLTKKSDMHGGWVLNLTKKSDMHGGWVLNLTKKSDMHGGWVFIYGLMIYKSMRNVSRMQRVRGPISGFIQWSSLFEHLMQTILPPLPKE